jgi:hypothetical protein
MNGTKNFWTDFDFSAYFNPAATPPGPAFFGAGDMQDATGGISTLLDPQNRWGFDGTSAPGAGWGLPKEFVNGNFIGRYVHAETSDLAFAYPATLSGPSGNPMANTNAQIGYNAATGRAQYNKSGTFTDFSGSRVGEDALMTNVVAFDVKVWDPAGSFGPDGKPGISGIDIDGDGVANNIQELGAVGSDDGDWRDVGHAGLIGFYRAANCQNLYYGANRYDSWGPNVNIDGTAGNDAPPYRPVFLGPDGRPGMSGIDDDGINGVDDPGEIGFVGSDDFAPLTAIKITIRFYDVTSKQIRDVSGVFSLTFQP